MRELRADETTGGAFGTHAPDMEMFAAFLADCAPGARLRLLAIQPETMAPGPMSRPVHDAVLRLADRLARCPRRDEESGIAKANGKQVE